MKKLLVLLLFLNACHTETPHKRVRFANLPPTLHALKTMKLMNGHLFEMGNEASIFDDQKPQHELVLSQFYIDQTPVTYKDYIHYLNEGGQAPAFWHDSTYHQTDQPVTGITWHQAADFCNWRSLKEGLQPVYVPTQIADAWGYPVWELDSNANGYRLPTEAEWEYAARGGLKQKKYPWGDEFKDQFANYDTERGQKKGDWWRLASVYAQKENAFGLFNMSGNIWQWCHDWYDPKSYQFHEKYDPKGVEMGRTKVLRGGSWGSVSPEYLTVSRRSFAAPSHYNFDIGFRCVLPVSKFLKDSTVKIIPKVNYTFYKLGKASQEIFKSVAYQEHEDFSDNLAKFFHDFFSNSLYFQIQVDEQTVLTPEELAKIVINVCERNNIHPLFLTAIMVSESGVGTCSFPRWFNNPMAYRWQNRLMQAGEPTYEDMPNVRNRKFKNLEQAFEAFCKGIRKPIYYQAAKADLFAFHRVYVGYESQQWLYSLSKVFRDVSGQTVEAHFPENNIGASIYTDWSKINPSYKKNTLFEEKQEPIKPLKPIEVTLPSKNGRYYLIYGSFGSRESAEQSLLSLQQKGFSDTKILETEGRFRVSVSDYADKQAALAQARHLQADLPNVWIWFSK